MKAIPIPPTDLQIPMQSQSESQLTGFIETDKLILNFMWNSNRPNEQNNPRNRKKL